MKRALLAAVAAGLLGLPALSLTAATADAGFRSRCHYDSCRAPARRYYAPARSYSNAVPQLYTRRDYRAAPRGYRAACGYGDCVCLRNLAVSTGSQVWWDRYQACSG